MSLNYVQSLNHIFNMRHERTFISPSTSVHVHTHLFPSHISLWRSQAVVYNSPSSSGNCQANHSEVVLGIHLISWMMIFLFSSETCLSRHMLHKFSITARNPKEVKLICYFILRVVKEVLMSSAGTTAEFRMLHNSTSITFIG